MARKTKEELNKLNGELTDPKTTKTTKSIKTTKTAVKSTSAVKSVAKKEPVKKVAKKADAKKIVSKKTKSDKTSTKKTATKKVAPKETVSKKSKSDKTSTRKTTTKKVNPKETVSKKSKSDKTSTRKTTTKKVNPKETVSKKSKTEKTTSKKAPTKKTATKKATTKKTPTKKITTKKATTTKTRTKKSEEKSNVVSINPIEYYDLPYRYNETIVKVLAQNPNTLFAYWDISDSDRENLEKQYGKLFFYNTKPVLVVHNLTDNYTFEIDIDDFANNWYINVNDTKCKYFVELGRRPKYENHNEIPVNYINVASSNTIEMPNDHILFFKDNDKIYFKNIKTNKITEKIFKSKTYSNKLSRIYSNYNLSETDDRFDFKNPSSQNPTSNVL